jgi:hypothetical protein
MMFILVETCTEKLFKKFKLCVKLLVSFIERCVAREAVEPATLDTEWCSVTADFC